MALSIDSSPSSPTASRSFWPAAISIFTGLIGFILIYISTTHNMLIAILDLPVHDWFVAHRNPTLTVIMLGITNILAPVTFAAIVLIGAFIWGFYKKEIWRPLLLVGAMGITMVVSSVIKNIVRHGRPPQGHMIFPLETDFSFPSGHTIGVAVATMVLAYLIYSRARIYLSLWCLGIAVAITIIAISRLYLGYHWLTDVTASVFLAFMILGVIMIIDRFKPDRIP